MSDNLPMSPAERKLAELKAKQSNRDLVRPEDSTALINIPNHLVCLIDNSGSMSSPFVDPSVNRYEYQTCLEVARQAMRQLISASDPETTAYTLMTFASFPAVVIPKSTNYTQFYNAKLHTAGSTNMHEGIMEAVRQRPSRIVMLSDGEPDGGRVPTEACMFAKEHKVIIDTISIGGASDEIMRMIAELTGGTWKRCNTPSELVDHFVALEPTNYLQLEHK